MYAMGKWGSIGSPFQSLSFWEGDLFFIGFLRVSCWSSLFTQVGCDVNSDKHLVTLSGLRGHPLPASHDQNSCSMRKQRVSFSQVTIEHP